MRPEFAYVHGRPRHIHAPINHVCAPVVVASSTHFPPLEHRATPRPLPSGAMAPKLSRAGRRAAAKARAASTTTHRRCLWQMMITRETFESMLAATRRLEDESAPGRTVWDQCPQVVLCDDCRTRAVLHSPPTDFPLRVSGDGIGCQQPIIWKHSVDRGFEMENMCIDCCEFSLHWATAQPIRNAEDDSWMVAQSWDTAATYNHDRVGE